MSMKLVKIRYQDLNSRQQESFNYQKISGVLADYGFVTIRLSDDWKGADFLAQHIHGETLFTSRYVVYDGMAGSARSGAVGEAER